MTPPAFNYSGGYSFGIFGVIVLFAIYDALKYQVLVAYRNGTFATVSNVPPPFNQFQYGSETAILNLVANSP